MKVFSYLLALSFQIIRSECSRIAFFSLQRNTKNKWLTMKCEHFIFSFTLVRSAYVPWCIRSVQMFTER